GTSGHIPRSAGAAHGIEGARGILRTGRPRHTRNRSAGGRDLDPPAPLLPTAGIRRKSARIPPSLVPRTFRYAQPGAAELSPSARRRRSASFRRFRPRNGVELLRTQRAPTAETVRENRPARQASASPDGAVRIWRTANAAGETPVLHLRAPTAAPPSNRTQRM